MSYEDLVALATELKDKLPDGIYPFACPVDFQTWYYQTVYANGGWILNDDKTETGYADPKTQEGIQCWIDMIDAGLSPNASTLAETGSDAMFEAGQIAMTLAGSYMVEEYSENEIIKDVIDCVEMPTFNGIEDNCINGQYTKAPRIKTKPSNLRSGLQALKLRSFRVNPVPLFPQDSMLRICLQKHILSIIWKLTPTTPISHIRCLSA